MLYLDFRDLKNRNWYPYTVATCTAVLFAFLLKNIDLIGDLFSFIWQMFCPLVAGAIIAYMMDPVARFFENQVFTKFKKVRLGRKSAVAAACVLIFGGMFVLLISLMPSLIRSITILIGNIDGYEKTMIEFLQSHGFGDAQIEKNLSSIIEKIKEIVPALTKNVLESTPHMGGNLRNFGMGCILAVYFLLYKKRIFPWIVGICKKIVRKEGYQDFVGFCTRCNIILLKYISCTLLDALTVGISNAVFMMIFRIPFVALISVIVGITNLLPTFGPLVGGATGFVILVLIKPRYALLFLIFTFIIQTIDGYVIKPKFFGNSLGVSSLWILIAIICGGKMFGVVGVLLAIPFAAIVQYLLEEILFPKVREESKGKNLELQREEV